jgi:polyhydroxyalkanoate synthesis regulator phasin
MGAITAFKDAIGETLADARERGDLTTDRAREVIERAVERAREGTAEARDRFDFVSRQEFDALRLRVDALEARLSGQEPASPSSPEEPKVEG